MAVSCKLESDLELARLETAFWESCQAVHISSVALHKIHAFLMGELLALEADKMRALSQQLEEMESEVAEMKTTWRGEISQLRTQLEEAKKEALLQSPHHRPPKTPSPPPVPPDHPAPPPLPPSTLPPTAVVGGSSMRESVSHLIPAPELVEMGDERPDSTSEEESNRPPQSARHRGRKRTRSKVVRSACDEVSRQREQDRAMASSGEEFDTDGPSERKQPRKLTNLTASLPRQVTELGLSVEGMGSSTDEDSGRGRLVPTDWDMTVSSPVVSDSHQPRGRGRGRGRGRRRGRGRGRGRGSMLARVDSEEMSMDTDSDTTFQRPERRTGKRGRPRKRGRGRGRGRGSRHATVGMDSEEKTAQGPERVRGTGKRGRPRKSGRGRPPRTSVNLTSGTVEKSETTVVTMTVSDSEATTAAPPTTTPAAAAPGGGQTETSSEGQTAAPSEAKTEAPDGGQVEEISSGGQVETTDGGQTETEEKSQHSPSPEIPLQNTLSPETVPGEEQGTSEVVSAEEPAGEVGGATGPGVGGQRNGSSGGRLLEKIVSSLVERSQSSAARGGGGRRKPLTAKKPLHQLTLVEEEEGQRGGRKRGAAVFVSTAGFTAPKLKTTAAPAP